MINIHIKEKKHEHLIKNRCVLFVARSNTIQHCFVQMEF